MRYILAIPFTATVWFFRICAWCSPRSVLPVTRMASRPYEIERDIPT